MGTPSSSRLLDYTLKQAIISAVQKGRKGENYILSGQHFTYREFYQLTIKELGHGALLVPVPVWLVVVCGFLFS